DGVEAFSKVVVEAIPDRTSGTHITPTAAPFHREWCLSENGEALVRIPGTQEPTEAGVIPNLDAALLEEFACLEEASLNVVAGVECNGVEILDAGGGEGVELVLVVGVTDDEIKDRPTRVEVTRRQGAADGFAGPECAELKEAAQDRQRADPRSPDGALT